MILYRHYDNADVLLYVGSTISFETRNAAHKMGSAWWRLVKYSKCEYYADAASLYDAETKAIKSENPRFNLFHTPQYKERLSRRKKIVPTISCIKCTKLGLLRGLCRSHYNQAAKAILSGKTTWDKLVKSRKAKANTKRGPKLKNTHFAS